MMGMDVKVSVIIPIYNMAEYLPQCIESVICQTLEEIEIICVDDGSTDASSRICDAYAEKDGRIKVIHKENGGLVSARKAGIGIASGEYCGYVDSDDWIEPDMYEHLYGLIKRHQAEMATCGYFLEGNYTTVHIDTVRQGFYDEKDMSGLRDKAIYDINERSSGLKASLCCKLFKRELIQGAQRRIPDGITMAEDKMCLLAALLDCRSVYVCHRAFYHYRIRHASMVHAGNEEYLLRVYDVYKYLKGLYSHRLFTAKMRRQSEIYVTELLYKGINTLLGFENRNMLWIDPCWLDRIPTGSKVILYGAGELGEKYRNQMRSRKDLQYVACVDFAHERLNSSSFPVEPPDAAQSMDYDCMVVTIKNSGKAREVIGKLEDMGIPSEKILWLEQPEFFWRFVQAEYGGGDEKEG